MASEAVVTDVRIDIRPVAAQDADDMRALYVLSLRANAPGFVQDLSYHGDIFARATQYQSNRGEMLGIFADGGLKGFGGLVRVDDSRVELGKLHLHPELQGLGIGRRMAEALIARARALGYDVITLHVTVTQKAAIGLYRKLGFVETERRVCTVLDADFDTVFMELKL